MRCIAFEGSRRTMAEVRANPGGGRQGTIKARGAIEVGQDALREVTVALGAARAEGEVQGRQRKLAEREASLTEAKVDAGGGGRPWRKAQCRPRTRGDWSPSATPRSGR